MDDRSCMVEVARYYVNFLAGESCGKCTPCREGLKQMLRILTDICEGRGTMEDLDTLELLSETMSDTSLCALGKTAPNPVKTTLRFFRDEYEAHIKEHRCPAGVCKALTSFSIDADACKGCSACLRACPAGAITGALKEAHVIDHDKCIGCGSCRESCKFEAVLTEGRHEADSFEAEPAENCSPAECGCREGRNAADDRSRHEADSFETDPPENHSPAECGCPEVSRDNSSERRAD